MNFERLVYRLRFVSRRCAAAAVIFLLVESPLYAAELYLCGGPAVYEVHQVKDQGKDVFRIDWIWKPEESEGLPASITLQFGTTDDCKPVSQGKEILITSSGGAVALVSRTTGNTLFWARVHNAHSAELLPGGLIAVMSSTGPGGDRIVLYDRGRSDQILTSLPIESAHGVVWDPGRQVLWALGGKQLLRIKVNHDEPQPAALTVEHAYPLPSQGGHDLQPASDGSVLYLTTESEALTWQPEQERFSPFAPLAGKKNVKSISIQPHTGRLAYTQASQNAWWTYTVHLRDPDLDIPFDSFLYKVRWDSTLH